MDRHRQQFSTIVDSPVFFLSLGPSAVIDSNVFTSHYFNITNNPVSRTTSPSTSTLTSSGIAATTNTADSSSSSSSTQVGLGVGLGVGIPIVLLLLALVGFLFYRNRKRNRPLLGGSPLQQSDFVIETGQKSPFGEAFEEGQRLSDEQRAGLLAQDPPIELPTRRSSVPVAELPER